jgi:hypothetical protein
LFEGSTRAWQSSALTRVRFVLFTEPPTTV